MDDEHQIDCVLLIDDDFVTNFLHENLLSEMQFCKNVKFTEDLEDALQFIENCYLPNENQKSL